MQKKFTVLAACLLMTTQSFTQDIFLSAYSKIPTGAAQVEKISFSSDGKFIAVSDSKGNFAFADTESNTVVKSMKGFGKVLYHEFLDNDKKVLVLKVDGELSEYSLPTFEKTPRTQRFASPLFTTLDPNQLYLTSLNKNNQIEIFDLKANMTQSRITTMGDIKNTLFMGFDRFGQQLAVINNIGETYNWELLNQKFLRQLKLQSGEYSGSRSVIHSAATSKGADHFVIGMQEVFIPKGGLQPGRQPERRNVLIAYDWTTGQEKKRVALRYRADGMAMGPTPSVVSYYSEDTRTIFLVNLDKGEIRGGVAVDERPTAISLSDNGELLAVGTVSGVVYLFEVIRNNPAEIRIINPPVNRNIGEQTVKGSSVIVEGKIEGDERMAQIEVNDQKAVLNADGSFQAEVSLVPGKNRIRVSAQNTSSQLVQKDIYINSEPVAEKSGAGNSNTYNKRVALVIGNADYVSAGKLRNTLNDAKSISTVLKSLGFDVMLIENGTYEAIKNAVYAFGDRIQDVDVSLFFYAGHGMEVDGTNYLVPVDANIESHLDIKQKCVPLTGVLNTMEFANDEGLNMIILDACRNNPFPAGKRGGAGLARINAPSGTLIAYSTDPGSVASDGEGTNGLYTGELLKQLKTSQRIEDIFMNTRNNVEHLSGGKQRPWEEARLKGVFYLK